MSSIRITNKETDCINFTPAIGARMLNDSREGFYPLVEARSPIILDGEFISNKCGGEVGERFNFNLFMEIEVKNKTLEYRAPIYGTYILTGTPRK